jgi:hypothetical protein
MKYLLIITFLLFSINLFPQEVEKTIIIKDSETDVPIEDATLIVLKTKQNYISNSEGVVTFLLKGSTTIQISHTSYISQTIRSSTLKDKITTIYLKNNVNTLDEIILTKQHPQKILTTLVENSVKNLTIPGRLKVYTREFFMTNDSFMFYNDGILNYQLYGKPKAIDTKILVEQNRSVGLADHLMMQTDLVGYNLNNITENYYNFKYLYPLLEASAKKQYNFIIKQYTKNENYYLMSVIPLDDSSGLLDDFTIIYDNKKKIIIEINTQASLASLAKNNKPLLSSKKIIKSNFKAIYKIDGHNYYLLSSKEEIGFKKEVKGKMITYEIKNLSITINFSTQNYTYNESEVFKDKTLYNKKNTILNNYWENTGLVATEEEEKIILSIED